MAELDNRLSWAMVIDVSIAIVLLMISIWAIVLSLSHEPIRRLANVFLMQAIMASAKLLIYIHWQWSQFIVGVNRS